MATASQESGARHDGPALRCRPRIVVADGNPLIRAGLSQVLAADGRVQVVGEAATGHDAIDACARYRPEIAIVDVDLADPDGLDAVRTIHRRNAETVIVLESATDDPDLLLEALRVGATGLVPKDVEAVELVDVVLRAARGEAAIASGLASRVLWRIANEVHAELPVPPPLTPREVEVLNLIAAGNTNREIADMLIVALGTVKVHVEHIIAKLGVRDRTEAAAKAVDIGIVHRDD